MLDCEPRGGDVTEARDPCFITLRQGGVQERKGVFSNKIISIYELKLGSFSFPPALLASAGPTDRIMALFSLRSYLPGLSRAFKEQVGTALLPFYRLLAVVLERKKTKLLGTKGQRCGV